MGASSQTTAAAALSQDWLSRPEKIGSFYSDLRNIQGIWTAHQIEMHDLKRNSRTILKIEKLQYNLPMKDDAFTLQALSRES